MFDFCKMCSIGEQHADAECSGDFHYKDDFAKDDWKCLKLRSGRSNLRNVCDGHKLSYLTLYVRRQRMCCNPLPNRHLKGSVKGVYEISMSTYRRAKGILPGKILCPACHKSIQALVGEEEEVESSQSVEVTPVNSQDIVANLVPPVQPEVANLQPQMVSPDLPRLRPKPTSAAEARRDSTSTLSTSPHSLTRNTASVVSSPGYVPASDIFNTMNQLHYMIGCTSVDKQRLKNEPFYGSNKLEDIMNNVRTILQHNAGVQVVKSPQTRELESYGELLELLKQKFMISDNNSQKMVVLSVLPPNWSISKIKEEFGPLGASEYLIKKLKILSENVEC